MTRIDNILLVEADNEATDFAIWGTVERPLLSYCKPKIYGHLYMEISPGSWQFIGTTDEVSEAICEKIFDKPVQKTRYEIGEEDFITATAAWNYLRRVNRVPSDKRHAILKEQK